VTRPSTRYKRLSFKGYLRAQGLSWGTVRVYRGIVRKMGEADPERFLLRVCQTAPSGTATTHRAAVKAWMRWVGDDPERLHLPRGKRPSPELREPLDEEMLTAFYEEAATVCDPVQTILMLLPRTGMRVSEVCERKLTDITVRRGVRGLYFAGKGNRWRFVPLSTDARVILDAYLDRRDHPGPWLWPGGNGAIYEGITHIHPERVRSWCRKLSGDLGFRVHPHLLRHTWATEAHRRGVPERTIQAVLGHSSIRTTYRYLHPDEGVMLDAIELVDRTSSED
jgi:integrase/recombinase XerD